jgi:hypothetical protein
MCLACLDNSKESSLMGTNQIIGFIGHFKDTDFYFEQDRKTLEGFKSRGNI